MNGSLVKVRRSISFYSVSGVYVAASVIIALISGGVIGVEIGLVVLALVAVGILVVSVRREVHTVHGLVDSQRDELLARIDQLLDALTAAGLDIPAAPGGEAPVGMQRRRGDRQ